MWAKKSLGQNFLKADSVLEKIISTGEVSSNDTVLEVGPGTGNLTKKLLEKAGKVIAVEKDDRLISTLEEKFREEISAQKLELIHADILDFDLNYKLPTTKYKLIANIPYYITGQLLRKFLENEHQPQKMVLMLQKEVAKRIIDKKGSLLSISVKIFSKPKYVSTVSKSFFQPQPKVDSAILLIDEISNPFQKKTELEKFFEILKTGFAQKRKKLLGNLKKKNDEEKIRSVFQACNLKENSRAEELGIEDWKCLTSKL